MSPPAARYDERRLADGRLRSGWDVLDLETWDRDRLRSARRLAARLLEDDGVTYHPPAHPGRRPTRQGGDGSRTTPAWLTGNRWRLDPLPTVVAAADWAEVGAGVAQRARLLEAVLADLYGARRLLTAGLLPAELVWRHGSYLRAAWGVHPPDRPRLVLAGTDLGRDASGTWVAIGDRTQAPSGLGYAMENRRVVARLLPEAYRRADLRRLTGFFNQLRDALHAQAPPGVEDPRVVVLTPAAPEETAFDQANVASLLGFPLVTGADLVVRGGRLWTRELGDRRPVDVVLRRVDDLWCDPLELRGDSELGVPGLLEAARRGSVVTANALGSGFVESPALAPFLPALSRALLDEPLRLPSAPAHWCGEPAGLAAVLDHLDTMVLRPVRPGGVPGVRRGVHGPGLSAAQLERWRARVAAEPGAWVGQEVLPLSLAPTAGADGLADQRFAVRAFAVAGDDGYAVLPGGLGRVVPDPTARAVPAGPAGPAAGRRDAAAPSKDVWVLSPSRDADAPETAAPAPPENEQVVVRAQVVPMVPRALENLFWMGRGIERADAAVRHVLVLRGLLDDFPVARLDPARGAVDVLARVLTRATGAAGALPSRAALTDADVEAVLRAHLVDGDRPGTVAHALDGVAGAAGAVRDQLSTDVFTVLGGAERACAELVDAPLDTPDVGSHLRDVGERVLAATLALGGITGANMVRDVGWQLLDVGRALERSLQTLGLLRWVLGDVHPPAVERHLVAAVVTAAESAVTHRRRYGGHEGVAPVLELLLLDAGNPRSVAFQLARLKSGVASLPGGGDAGPEGLLALLDEARADLVARTADALAASYPRLTETEELFTEHRDELVGLAERLGTRLRRLADGLAEAYFAAPVALRPLGSGFAGASGRTDAGGVAP